MEMRWWHSRWPLFACLKFYLFWRWLKPQVQGWLTRNSAWLLYKLARWGPGQGVIVEVGSAYGRSAIVLATASKRAGRGQVVSVDPHTGGITFLQRQQGPVNTYLGFAKNIQRFHLSDWIQPIVLPSIDAAKQWDGRPIRFLYIDGWHTYDAVKADIEGWFPYLVSGGIILFDDYTDEHYPEVKRCIDDQMTMEKVRLPLKVFKRKAWAQKI